MDFSLIFSFICGSLVGFVLYTIYKKVKLASIQEIANSIINSAEANARSVREKALSEAKEESLKFEMELFKLEKKHLEKEDKLKKTEEKLQKDIRAYETRVSELSKKEKSLSNKETESKERERRINESESLYLTKLEHLAKLSQDAAKEELKEILKKSVEQECEKYIASKIEEAQKDATQSALKIIQTAISRVNLDSIQDNTSVSIRIQQDVMKAKIIGKDGRNIRSFEALTGVSVIIDETPCTVFLSCFDPLRLHKGKIVLLSLIEGDKINPTIIEEEVKKAELIALSDIEKIGKEIANQAGISKIDPELINILGKLHFRTTAGQNLLIHSLEVSNIMGVLASELNLNVDLARRIGLLHDIGKALPVSHGFSHAIAGYNYVLSHGEDELVANGIGSHHNEMVPKSKEASLLKCADGLSASRRGARIDTKELYIKRLESLESVAKSFPQVLRAYAMDAGKELMVFVSPNEVDESRALVLARDIAKICGQKKIEENKFPSHSVKVSVIRESKAVEFVS